MAETQALTPKQKVDNVRTLLERLKPQLRMALPRHMTPDRMARVAMTTILRTPRLLDCDATSLAGAIVTCSQLGLEPDPVLGHAFLVPFLNRRRGVYEVVVIPGYKGLMKLARNSGELLMIDAHPVRPGDDFRYNYGLKPNLHHVPKGDPAGEPTHYYSVATFKAGGGQFVVMARAEVEHHRDRFSQAARKDDSPWATDFDAMAMKTCIRQMAKFLPASVELQRAAALDEMTEAGIPQELGAILDAPASDGNGAASTGLDRLSDKLEADRAAASTTTPPAEKGVVEDRLTQTPSNTGDIGDAPADAAGASTTEPGDEPRQPFDVTPERAKAFQSLVAVAGARKLTPKTLSAVAQEVSGVTPPANGDIMSYLSDAELAEVERRLRLRKQGDNVK